MDQARVWAGLTAILLSSSLVASPALASDADWRTAANIGEGGLVALALGKSVASSDWGGAKQLGYSVAVTAGTTQVLKHAFPEARPNGSDNLSFPSGHTSVSFAAAGYLHQRYGWRWGLPAAVAAGFVGLSRVQSKDHRWDDVLVGAALGEATAFLFTSPRDGHVTVLPWAGRQGGGVMIRAEF